MAARVAAASLVVSFLLACSDRDLFVPQELRRPVYDNRISVGGGFCAEGADDLRSFLKVMFVIDRSNSMNVTDPNNQRVSAVRDVVMRFVEDPLSFRLRQGVEFALLSFYGDVVTHTRDKRGLPGFSDDGPQILFALTEIARTGSNTGYDKALAQAYLMLDTDMARLEDAARVRSRYEVIFLSDGMPFPNNCRGEANAPSAAVAAVKRIAQLESMYDTPLKLHTAFASDPRMFTRDNDIDPCGRGSSDPYESDYNDSIGQETRALLQDMAVAGNGSFAQFRNGDAINFLDFEFAESRRIYALSNFVISNITGVPAGDVTLADTDGDGLTDELELELGTRATLADSDGDGFNDALEWRFRLTGFDPLDPTDAQCDDLSATDTDGDRLLDCEETFFGTLRRAFDTDSDGFPDFLEIGFGTDPSSATPMQDEQADSDGDGGSDANEMRWHTDPSVDDVAQRSEAAYDPKLYELPITGGAACYNFDVGNITLASTRDVPAHESHDGRGRRAGWNQVMLYFAQRPYDDPFADPIYRVACVEGRYVRERDIKVPPHGHIEIPERRPSDTYRASAVLRPNRYPCHASVNEDCGLNALWCRHEDNGDCQCYAPPRDPSEPRDGNGPIPCPACSNGVDDDADGLTDFPFDPDCFDTVDDDEGPNTACGNGLDDDGDGRVDWPMDPGCDSAYDTAESTPAALPQCSDGIDNDSDGAADFPNDADCYAAADPSEIGSIATPRYACSDLEDNDGDGLIDLADPGCFSTDDIDEDGPATCFFCERVSDALPNQCDISAGYCKSRSGRPPSGPCSDSSDCRGSVCRNGVCALCIRDSDCDGGTSGMGVCDARRGWCLSPVYEPTPCADDAACAAQGGGPCETDIGYCRVDPYRACRTQRDCRVDELCSEERGFCLKRVFEVERCAFSEQEGYAGECAQGVCNREIGWCLPDETESQCRHADECPLGECRETLWPAFGTPVRHCDQQTFVFPEDFNASVDCVRPK